MQQRSVQGVLEKTIKVMRRVYKSQRFMMHGPKQYRVNVPVNLSQHRHPSYSRHIMYYRGLNNSQYYFGVPYYNYIVCWAPKPHSNY